MKPAKQEIIDVAREAGATNEYLKHYDIFIARFAALLLERFGAGGGEPVATIEIATSGSSRVIDNHFADCVRDWADGEYKLYTHPSPTDLRAEYLRGLEDAAKVCDERANAVFPNTKQGLGFSFSQQWDAARESDKNCAHAIRALKGKQ